jgi:hypothetical protein
VSLRKGLQRLEGVADAKLIVKPPQMVVRMKPGYWPEIARMQKTIKDAGYTPNPAQVELRVTGEIVRQGDRLAVQLDRMRAPLTLPVVAAREEPETAAHLERHVGDHVELEGLWQPPAAGVQGPGALAVTAITGAEDSRRSSSDPG